MSSSLNFSVNLTIDRAIFWSSRLTDSWYFSTCDATPLILDLSLRYGDCISPLLISSFGHLNSSRYLVCGDIIHAFGLLHFFHGRSLGLIWRSFESWRDHGSWWLMGELVHLESTPISWNPWLFILFLDHAICSSLVVSSLISADSWPSDCWKFLLCVLKVAIWYESCLWTLFLRSSGWKLSKAARSRFGKTGGFGRGRFLVLLWVGK